MNNAVRTIIIVFSTVFCANSIADTVITAPSSPDDNSQTTTVVTTPDNTQPTTIVTTPDIAPPTTTVVTTPDTSTPTTTVVTTPTPGGPTPTTVVTSPDATPTTVTTTTPPGTTVPPTTVTITTTVDTGMDDNIVSNIYARYSKDAALIGTNISASSEKGIVTLSGTVTAQSQADAAISAARSVPNVRDVRSNIVVTTNSNSYRPQVTIPNY